MQLSLLFSSPPKKINNWYQSYFLERPMNIENEEKEKKMEIKNAKQTHATTKFILQ